MDEKRKQLNDFFDAYESRMNKSVSDHPVVDVEATAAAFADFFVEASPVGVMGGANDATFRERIPAGAAHYRNIGTKAMSITARDLTPLDDFHWMVKVHWHSRYEKQDGTQAIIDFDVIYFVQMLDNTPKIFAYITGDEEKVMKENGLIADEQPDAAS